MTVLLKLHLCLFVSVISCIELNYLKKGLVNFILTYIFTYHLRRTLNEKVKVLLIMNAQPANIQTFYKIILDKRAGNYRAIAFLIPNAPSDRSFYEYAVSIDEIERKTGIDFFPKLSKELQASFESTSEKRGW